MTYLILYVSGIASILWVARVGWLEALKRTVSVLIPSVLIILFNAKAGRFLFKNPILGVISLLPTVVIVYKASQPLVVRINNWIDKKTIEFVDMKDVIDAEVISKEDA
ncbi:hypothetical protein [Prochlorococcus sp. MIT 1341]|uniref:hypothetical protein n=1 Tax=Prochlorococcus sp. MIT 1341 TaxID=3096221 RepID=UPI002A750B53|nr:hypothetical protein [Prochlorococcus sp. MIT 1341]